MAGVLYKVKDECTEATSNIGIDYWLYMMASPVQYIICNMTMFCCQFYIFEKKKERKKNIENKTFKKLVENFFFSIKKKKKKKIK